MDVELVRASVEEKPVLQRMMELYLYDFSEFEDMDLNADGLFEYPYLDAFWTEETRHPFIIRVAGKLAGFVLVRQLATEPKAVQGIAEFFVMRKYRRLGVGQQAARAVFQKFTGSWEIGVLRSNVGAQGFWRSVVGKYTMGRYTEIEMEKSAEGWEGILLQFENSQQQT
ncbi:MAG TPA: GNAT family N-acetyltransferase [Ardenticatenaceae bacterium]